MWANALWQQDFLSKYAPYVETGTMMNVKSRLSASGVPNHVLNAHKMETMQLRVQDTVDGIRSDLLAVLEPMRSDIRALERLPESCAKAILEVWFGHCPVITYAVQRCRIEGAREITRDDLRQLAANVQEQMLATTANVNARFDQLTQRLTAQMLPAPPAQQPADGSSHPSATQAGWASALRREGLPEGFDFPRYVSHTRCTPLALPYGTPRTSCIRRCCPSLSCHAQSERNGAANVDLLASRLSTNKPTKSF